MQKAHPRRFEHHRGQFLWRGRFKRFTLALMMLPWLMWWQVTVVLGITYKYITHLLLAYYLDSSSYAMNVTLFILEIIFLVDWVICVLHIYWSAVRLHIRVYRRALCFLVYDGISLLPIPFYLLIYTTSIWPEYFNHLILIARWLAIIRIYRLYCFYSEVNGTMRKSRRMLFVMQNMTSLALMLHCSTCLWYSVQSRQLNIQPWYHDLGYPSHVTTEKLKFDNYLQCLYFAACCSFNTVFGDTFPTNTEEKVLTAFIMLAGFCSTHFWFSGILAWEIVLRKWRWANFVDGYHHMLIFLKNGGAPAALIEQAKNYKQHLWNMKKGILTCDHLNELPHALQTEMIFDINVAYFHHSLLFRDTGEPFMRQISLLVRHELYLEGQQIWSQGVVKNGMFCIKKGVIEMLSDEDDESPMIAFKEGTVLGEVSLFFSIPSKVTVKAASYVELQVLRRSDFIRAMAEIPQMLNIIRLKIKSRIENAKLRQQSIADYDKTDSRLIRTRYRPMKLLKDHLAGVQGEDPTFVDDSHLYYKDENNKRVPKFTDEYLELYNLTNNVTTVDAPRICLKSNFPWILEPNTQFTHMFDIIHFIIVIYVCLMAPIHAILLMESDVERVLDCIVVFGLMLNIYLQLTTSIVEKGVRKETVKEIAEMKMATFGFYLDIISVFPLYIFADSLDPNGETMGPELSKLCPVLQVWHVWDYMQKWESTFDSNVKFLCLCKYFLLLIVNCYWAGCLLYLYSCPKRLCNESSWMAQLIFYETKVLVTNDAKHERPLLSSLAFGTAVFTGSGTSDYVPGAADLLVIVVLFTLGMYLNSSYIAKICSIYMLQMQRKMKFRESMRELFYFLTVNRVSGKIKSRVRKFFSVQWYYNNAISPSEIFKDMSANIEQEVLSIEMVETLLHCPLFQECSQDFLQTIAGNTVTVLLPDNEVIQHAADISRDMYIVHKGHCKILNSNGAVVSILGPGSHFGVVEMVFGLPKVHTVITVTNCILRHLEYSALVQAWSTFPDVSHHILTLLQDPEIHELVFQFEDGKPMTGRLDTKTNRIAQEIKESFVVLRTREEKREYVKEFNKLGYLRYLRYVFLPGCITPHGIFLKFWCILRIMLSIYYVLSIPYAVAVKLYAHTGMYYYPDIFFYVDIIVMSYVAFYNENSLLITHPLLCVRHYLKTTFILDVLAIFPFEQVIRAINDHVDKDLCRLNRLLLVTRITGAFYYWESNIMRVNIVVVMLKYLPVVVAYVNFMTAVFFMSACRTWIMPEYSSFILANCSRVQITPTVAQFALNEYLTMLFWVFELFIGSGCSPTLITRYTDTWLAITLQVAGFLYFAFMFGYIASTRSATSQALLEHNENTRDLENFLYQENVDPNLTAKTLKYFEYVWKRTNGSNPQKICRGLNSALMEDTLVFMYERALREVPLFGKVERSFIRIITQHLNEMYFLKGETVVQHRDIQRSIYIIYRGKVDVLNSYNETVSCMGPGGMFGNFTGQTVSCSDVSIYASRSLDLLVIPSQTFFNLTRYYPKIQEPLQKAFASCKDYILPITMDNAEDSSEDESGDDDIESDNSGHDSRSGSSKMDSFGVLASNTSHSNISQAKSSVSVATYQSYMHVSNLIRPGTFLFQCMGYLTSLMVTANYVLVLYEIVTLNDCQAIFWLQWVFDVYFFVRIFLNMHQAYVNKRGDFVTTAAKCRARYATHKLWVWTDILANFPMVSFGFCFKNHVLKAMHYLRANKLFRLIYLLKFYRGTAAELTNNLTTLQGVTTVFVVILLIHSATCIWLLTMIAIEPTCIIRPIKMHLIDEEAPHHEWDYVTSFYVIVSELTNTGGDEFQIEHLLPLTILAFVLISGKMLAAMVVATSIQVAYSTKHALTNYERKTGEVIDMLKNQGLSTTLYKMREISWTIFTGYQTKKFWKYVQQLWVNERGRQLPVLLARTPYVRRCDLMSAMFGHHLRNCYLFADTGEAFLRQLTASLEFTCFFPGNYILTAGDSEARMYWVASGTVSVVSVRNDLTEITHELLKAGDIFGILQGLNKGILHVFSYRAESNVSILTLSLDSWSNILQFFPEAQKIISERSEYLFAQVLQV